MKKLLLLTSWLFCLPVLGAEVESQILEFGYLNNTDNALVIAPNQAQDILNVRLSKNGNSIIKREGYGEAFELTDSTSAVHGVFSFYDSSGADVMLFFNGSDLHSSISGGTPSVLFSTGTDDATWDCTDHGGQAYCVSSARVPLIKTDGTDDDEISTAPLGTMVTSTVERLVIAGMSAAPSRIDFSARNDFTDWTVAVEPEDPFQLTITAAGSNVTHVTSACGGTIWFKQGSFGMVLEGESHIDWKNIVISESVGTLDNTSVYREGILYFRGQDSHIYAYNCSNYTKLTKDIEGTINQSQTRASNSWEQTSQSDFESGSFSPDDWEDTTTTAGTLTNKTTTYTISTEAQWSDSPITLDGALLADVKTNSGSVRAAFPDEFTSFRDGTSDTYDLWDIHNPDGSASVAVTSGELQIDMTSASDNDEGGVLTAFALQDLMRGTTVQVAFNKIDPQRTATILASVSVCLSKSATGCEDDDYLRAVFVNTAFPAGYRMQSFTTSESDPNLSISSDTASVPFTFTLYVATNALSYTYGAHYHSATHTVANGDYYLWLYATAFQSPTVDVDIDYVRVIPQQFDVEGWNYDTGGSATYWDTFMETAYFDVFSESRTSDSGDEITFRVDTSEDGTTVYDSATVTDGAKPAADPAKYFKAVAQFDIQTLSGTAPLLDDMTQVFFSSGTYHSAVHQAENITAWDTLIASVEDNGGDHTFYIRSSTGVFTVDSSTPTWTAISPGNIPTVTASEYFQIRDDFSATESTHTPSMTEFTQNWFEGNASDKAYATYHDDAIVWAVASGAGATANNKWLRYDLNNPGWTLYDIPSNGFLIRNNALYFGSSSEGKIFKFGDADSDDGSAIEAYWKSKDFVFGSPFLEKDFRSISVAAKTVSNSSFTVTYGINATETAYQIPTSGSMSFVHTNRNLPITSQGKLINLKFGNNAANQPFEIFAVQADYRRKSWRPE